MHPEQVADQTRPKCQPASACPSLRPRSIKIVARQIICSGHELQQGIAKECRGIAGDTANRSRSYTAGEEIFAGSRTGAPDLQFPGGQPGAVAAPWIAWPTPTEPTQAPIQPVTISFFASPRARGVSVDCASNLNLNFGLMRLTLHAPASGHLRSPCVRTTYLHLLNHDQSAPSIASRFNVRASSTNSCAKMATFDRNRLDRTE